MLGWMLQAIKRAEATRTKKLREMEKAHQARHLADWIMCHSRRTAGESFRLHPPVSLLSTHTRDMMYSPFPPLLWLDRRFTCPEFTSLLSLFASQTEVDQYSRHIRTLELEQIQSRTLLGRQSAEWSVVAHLLRSELRTAEARPDPPPTIKRAQTKQRAPSFRWCVQRAP